MGLASRQRAENLSGLFVGDSLAGDWIKMRGNLWDDPRISSVCDSTEQPEAMVIGALYWLWATADQHTENGYMQGYSYATIDRKTGIKGFCAALEAIDWIVQQQGGVNLIRFQEHNGVSAKRRSTEAQRKANVRKVSASDADKKRASGGQTRTDCGAREEKRREESSEAIASGVPPTDREMIFAKGVPLLTAASVTDRNARSMLASLCRDHGETLVLQAVEQTAVDGPGEPVAWIQRILKPHPKSRGSPYDQARADRAAEFAPGIAKKPLENLNVTAIAGRGPAI